MTRDFARFLRRFAGRISLLLILIVVQSALSIIPILIGQLVIDEGVLAGDAARLTQLGMFLVAVACMHSVTAFAERAFAARIGEDMVLRLRLDLYDHLRQQSVGFFNSAKTGAIASRVHGDVTGVQRLISGTLPSVVSAAVTLLSAGIALIILEWRLAVAVLVAVPLVYGVTAWISRALKIVTRKKLTANATLVSRVVERFSAAGVETIQQYGCAQLERAAFNVDAMRIRDLAVRQVMLGAGLSAALTLTMGVATAGAYVVTGLWTISGTVSMGTMVAMVALLARLYSPVVTLSGIKVDLVAALVSLNRVQEVLNFKPHIMDRPDARKLPPGQGASVVFSNVSFEYPSSTGLSIPSLMGEKLDKQAPRGPTLDRFDLTVEPGMTVGVVGLSGAGKSTLARLLVRSWEATSGRVLVGGMDVRRLTLESLRSTICVVSQAPFLFNDSIRANLLMAKPDADEDELVSVCRDAQIWSVIEAAPDGLETIVGDGGLQMSGGERQRISIARLLLRDPRVVVLDEATSHLDNATENALQQSLQPYLKQRTCLIIAHRLATVRHADLIVVMEGGSLVEKGCHNDLIEAGGLYTRLSRSIPRYPHES